jgi:hypothetical protein
MLSPNTPPASSMLSGQGQAIDISTIQEGKSQALANISELQNIEKEYFNKLQQGNTNLTDEDKDLLIKKINEISQMRINLYKNLNEMYNFYNVNIGSTKDTMTEQSAAISIVENELNESKKRMKIIEEQKYNKLRLVEINEYYGLRYKNHTNIMKTIVFICIPVLIISVLFNRGILTPNIYKFLLFIVLIIGMFFLLRQIYYTFGRDNMNYQEYNWHFDSSKVPVVDTNPNTTDPWALSMPSMFMCIGQQCCDVGYTYDSSPSVNKCVLSTTASSLGSSETANTTLGSSLLVPT